MALRRRLVRQTIQALSIPRLGCGFDKLLSPVFSHDASSSSPTRLHGGFPAFAIIFTMMGTPSKLTYFLSYYDPTKSLFFKATPKFGNSPQDFRFILLALLSNRQKTQIGYKKNFSPNGPS